MVCDREEGGRVKEEGEKREGEREEREKRGEGEREVCNMTSHHTLWGKNGSKEGKSNYHS